MRKLFFVFALLSLVVSCNIDTASAQFYGVDSSEKVHSTLITPISSIQAAPFKVKVATGSGVKFSHIPTPFIITIAPASESAASSIEEFVVSAVVGDSLTISRRAVSNTTAQAWAANSYLGIRVSYAVVKQLQDTLKYRFAKQDSVNHRTDSVDALLPAMSGHANSILTTDGSALVWVSSLPIASGGTGGVTRAAAFNNLVPDTTGNTNYVLKILPGGGINWVAAPGTGTVTAVGLNLPSTLLTVTSGTVTTGGTLAATLTQQNANTVFAGPVFGSAAIPTNRALVPADIPQLDASKTTTGVFVDTLIPVVVGDGVNGGGLGAGLGKQGAAPAPQAGDSIRFLKGNGTWASLGTDDLLSGTLPIARGGTGATTANGALKNLTPDSTGHTGQVLGILAGGGYTWEANAAAASGTVTSIATSAPITGGTITTTGTIGITQATTSTNGYLTSTDWNTFNNKGTGTVTAVTTSAPLTGTVTTSGSIGISQSTTSTNGYLSSTDWNTFNNKQPALPSQTGNGGKFLTTSGATSSSVLSWALPIIPLTSQVSGTLPIANGGTGQTTANNALNALLPSQTSASGKVLTSNGTDAAWQTPSANVSSLTQGGVVRLSASTGAITVSTPNIKDDGSTPPTPLAVTGSHSVAVGGSSTNVTGGYSAAIAGSDNLVSGSNAVVLGGSQDTASAASSAAIAGEGLKAVAQDQVVVGKNNDTTLAGAGPLFTVGNGADATHRTNALEVFSSGDIYASGVKIFDNSPAKIPVAALSTGTNSYVLTMVSGTPAWAAVSGTGTVTSVDVSPPSWLTSSGPVTSSGSITLTPTTGQTANRFLATPNGSTGAVALRAIAVADVPTLNQNTTGTSANVTGTVALANGGTGQTSAQAAMNALAGAVTSTQYLRGNGTNVVMSAIQAGDVPTLNQNTTGTASNVTGTVAIANGGTGQTTRAAGIKALLPDTTGKTSQYLSVLAGGGIDWSAAGGGGSGTVTSVALTAPSMFSVSGSPITGSGTLALSYSGTALPIANGGTGQTTAQTAMDALAGAVTTGQYLRGNGTHVVMAAISAGDVPTLNQNTTGTAANVTGTVAVANGGTGLTSNTLGDIIYSSATNTYSNLAGNTTTTKKFLTQTGNGSVSAAPAWGTIAAGDVPTLNQNTTGTAANVTGTVAIANGGTGATTQGAAIDALAGAVTSGQYLRGNGTHVVMAAISAGDVPTLNQNTTGTASNVTGTVVVANGGTGATTLTNHGVLLGQGTSAVAATSAGTAGQFLTSGGASADPGWTTTLPIANGGTGQTTRAAAFNALVPDTTGQSGNVLGVVAGGGISWVAGGGGGGAVSSVFSRTGAVVATSGDYTAAQVTNAADKTAANTFADQIQTFRQNNIKAVVTDGVKLSNLTASDATNTVQYSPAIEFNSQAWKSNATAASQTEDWRMYAQPATGAAAAQSSFKVQNSQNGAAWADILTLSDGGNLTSTGSVSAVKINATSTSLGFTINSAAPTGHYLRGNGTGYIDAVPTASDITNAVDKTAANTFTEQIQTIRQNNITTTFTDGLQLANNTAATSGVAVQQSPNLTFKSNVWNTTATAANNTFDGRETFIPTSGATPSAKFSWATNKNAAGYTERMSLTDGGVLTATSFAGSGASLTALDAGNISTGTLGVARGGTGIATLPQHTVPIGNGTSGFNNTGTGTSGQVLTSNGASADPTWQTPSGGGTAPTFAYLTSDFTTTSTTLTDVTGLSFAVGASETWIIEVHLMGTVTNSSTMQIGINGPASPTLVSIRTDAKSGSTGLAHNRFTAFNVADNTFTWNNTAEDTWSAMGVITSSAANAGTIQVRCLSTDGSTVTIHSGSFLRAYKQ